MDGSRREEERSWGHKWVFSFNAQWGWEARGPEGEWMMINPPICLQGLLHLPPDPYTGGFCFCWGYSIQLTIYIYIPFLFSFTPSCYFLPLPTLYENMVDNIIEPS